MCVNLSIRLFNQKRSFDIFFLSKYSFDITTHQKKKCFDMTDPNIWSNAKKNMS